MKKKPETCAKAAQLRTAEPARFGLLPYDLGSAEFPVYEKMRAQVPILDAAIGKLVRLTGGFTVSCADTAVQNKLQTFLDTVPIGRGQYGIACFLEAYLDSLLTYGRAVGEMVVSGGEIVGVCWGDVRTLAVKQGKNPLEFELAAYNGAELKPLPYQNLLLFSTRNPNPANPYGVSLFASMPFLTDVLLRIFKTIGTNWERAGNVRYCVSVKPDANGASTADTAEQVAQEWSRAMRESANGDVRDFIAVGDVSIRVIGADGQILDSSVPVRQILEQLVAKTGLPPFMLGLSWSATERMSRQQADLLTSELWAVRRTVQPALERICATWLKLHGYSCRAQIVWDEISLQDEVEHAHAALYLAQAEKIKREEKA